MDEGVGEQEEEEREDKRGREKVSINSEALDSEIGFCVLA